MFKDHKPHASGTLQNANKETTSHVEINVTTKPFEINASMDLLSMHIMSTIQNLTTQIVGSIIDQDKARL